jgi:hypothetical protein
MIQGQSIAYNPVRDRTGTDAISAHWPYVNHPGKSPIDQYVAGMPQFFPRGSSAAKSKK